MARKLPAGQQAAARYAKARRGELGLSQEALAKKAYVSVRAIQNFEAGRTWPNADILSRLERLGLELVVGRLSEYAVKHNHDAKTPSDVDELIAAVLESNLHPDLKLRLVDRLRSIATQKIRDELPGIERQIAGTDRPGEGHPEGREIA